MGSVASSRPRAVRPYRSPSVEDAPEGSDPLVLSFDALKQKERRTALGWKLSARRPLPESAGILRARFRAYCLKCSHTYFNFLDQMCWTPKGLDKCDDCLEGRHRCLPVRILPSLPLPVVLTG